MFLSYNLMPRDMAKCRRRIRLENIASATFSNSSTEFAIHVPEEYDYRFKAVLHFFQISRDFFLLFCFKKHQDQMDILKQVLAEVYKAKVGEDLRVQTSGQSKLDGVTVTKDVARLQVKGFFKKQTRRLLFTHKKKSLEFILRAVKNA